jgi:ferritin-like protein
MNNDNTIIGKFLISVTAALFGITLTQITEVAKLISYLGTFVAAMLTAYYYYKKTKKL